MPSAIKAAQPTMDSQQAWIAGISEREPTSEFTIVDPGDAGLIAISPKASSDAETLEDKNSLDNLEDERPIKKRKVSKEHTLLVGDDVSKESIVSDPYSETTAPQHSITTADPNVDKSASEQKDFSFELRALLDNVGVPPFIIYGQELAPELTGTEVNASVDLLSQSPKRDGLTKDQIDDAFIQSLVNEDWHHQQSSSLDPECPAHDQTVPLDLDFPSSPVTPSYRSSLLPQEMQSPSTPPPLDPPAGYKIVKDLMTGNDLPNSYLAHLREPVDPTFSDDNWGNAYYFPDTPTQFKYIEDYRPKPYHSTDRDAVNRGMRLRAMAIPRQTEEESKKSYKAVLDKAWSIDNVQKDPPTSMEGMQQRIHTCVAEAGRPRLFRDLQWGVQRQKIMNSRRAMQGIDAMSLVGPGVHPFRGPYIPFGSRRLNDDVRPVIEEIGHVGSDKDAVGEEERDPGW